MLWSSLDQAMAGNSAKPLSDPICSCHEQEPWNFHCAFLFVILLFSIVKMHFKIIFLWWWVTISGVQWVDKTIGFERIPLKSSSSMLPPSCPARKWNIYCTMTNNLSYLNDISVNYWLHLSSRSWILCSTRFTLVISLSSIMILLSQVNESN